MIRGATGSYLLHELNMRISLFRVKLQVPWLTKSPGKRIKKTYGNYLTYYVYTARKQQSLAAAISS